VIEFKVHRFSAPEGTFSKDSGVWNLVTGPLTSAAAVLRLADNGFRAAVGRESDRLPLRLWLDEIEGVRSAVDTAMPDANRVVELDLGLTPSRQTLFYYDRQGALHGLDLVDARAKFQLTLELRSPSLRDVWLRVVPGMEEPPGRARWVMTPDGPREEPVIHACTFDDLAFSADIPEGGFLLLGPTRAALDQPLAGRPFFVRTTAGETGDAPLRRESIYVISPIIRSYTEDQAGEAAQQG
jgi:hypothetical protein